MTSDPQSITLGHQSGKDAALDRRLAVITRVLKWMGWTFLAASLVILVLTFSPVSPISDHGVVMSTLAASGIGALYLVRAVRLRHRISLIIGGAGFAALALAVVAFLIYGMIELFSEFSASASEAVVVIAIFSAIFLSISLGFLAIGSGLLRLALPKK